MNLENEIKENIYLNKIFKILASKMTVKYKQSEASGHALIMKPCVVL